MTGTRQLHPLTNEEALSRLGSVPFGRVVFSQNAMPAIRPVNHVVDCGAVIIRTHLGAALMRSIDVVVAYEADAIDPQARLGWSVVITGYARHVQQADEVRRYEEMLRPWVDGPMNQLIRIRPRMITGYELVDGTVRESA